MSRVTIINGHPHDDPDHFVHALASTYAKAAEAAHEVRIIQVARLDFPILRDPADWKSGDVPAGLRAVQEDISWADHLVFLYPLWLGDVPALLKAFVEQVSRSQRSFPQAAQRQIREDHRYHGHAGHGLQRLLQGAQREEPQAQRTKLRRRFSRSNFADRQCRKRCSPSQKVAGKGGEAGPKG